MLEIKSFVKKERPSEAVQFEGGRHSATELATWAESFPNVTVKYMGIQDFLMVNTAEGWGATVHKDQWLISTPEGFISLDDEEFRNKYQEIDRYN